MTFQLLMMFVFQPSHGNPKQEKDNVLKLKYRYARRYLKKRVAHLEYKSWGSHKENTGLIV